MMEQNTVTEWGGTRPASGPEAWLLAQDPRPKGTRLPPELSEMSRWQRTAEHPHTLRTPSPLQDLGNDSLLWDPTAQFLCSARGVVSHSDGSDYWWSHGLQPPGSSVRGVSQAKILEQIVNCCSRVSSNPGIELQSPASPALAGRCFSTVSPQHPVQAIFFQWEKSGENLLT